MSLQNKIINYYFLTICLVATLQICNCIVCLFSDSWAYNLNLSQLIVPICSGMLIASFSSLLFSNSFEQIKKISFVFWLLTFFNIVFISIVSVLVYYSDISYEPVKLNIISTIVFAFTTAVSVSYKLIEFKNLDASEAG